MKEQKSLVMPHRNWFLPRKRHGVDTKGVAVASGVSHRVSDVGRMDLAKRRTSRKRCKDSLISRPKPKISPLPKSSHEVRRRSAGSVDEGHQGPIGSARGKAKRTADFSLVDIRPTTRTPDKETTLVPIKKEVQQFIIACESLCQTVFQG